MDINDLANDISRVSLYQNGEPAQPVETKKHRRPNRAFHSFNNQSAPSFSNSPAFNQSSISSLSPQVSQSGGINDNPYSRPQTPMNGQIYVGPDVQAAQPTMTHFVPSQRLENQQFFLERTFLTATDSVPPLSTTRYYASDQGSCDPRLMALSMYNIPNEDHLRAATKLPVGVTLQAFAKTVPDDLIPVVDATNVSDGPIRCRRCRAYVNPRFQFMYDSKVICNLCHIKTQVPNEQLVPIGPNGQRVDPQDKPELTLGSVDFLVPNSYNVSQTQPSMPLHYVFLLDITAFANENKSSLAAIEGIRSSIDYMRENQPKCKVAIIAFDEWIRFFNLRSDLEQTQEYLITDVKDIFLPLNKGLFALPSESMHVIQDVLVKLETYIVDERFSHRSQSCYGSALEAAKLALDEATNKQGGKIIATLNTLPTTGHGNLSLIRDDGVKKHMKCQDDFYKKLSHELLKSWIGLDLFVTSSAFIDLPTSAHPALITSGQLQYYSNFNIQKDEFKFVKDFMRSVSDTVGYQGMFKVRSSSGLSVYNYYSESVENSDRDPVIPVVSRQQSFDILFKYDDKLKTGEEVGFQAGFLYTDINGIRKVRVINTTAAVNQNVVEIFKFVNQDVITNIMVKDVLTTLGDCNFAEIKKNIDNKIFDIFTQYRALCGGSLGAQLVLPDSLKTLPMYMLSFQKTDLMKQNKSSARGNDRFYDYFVMLSYSSARLSYKLYPQIIPLHEYLDETDLTFYDQNNQLLQIQDKENLSVRCAHQQLVNGGCYLIFQGASCYLWFNENTNEFLLNDLLGYQGQYSEVELLGGRLPDLQTDINIKARNVIANWQQIANLDYIPVIPLRANVDPYYSHVMNQLMCEDRSIELVESFDNYLITIHRHIRENIENDKFVKIMKASDERHETFAQKFIQF